VRGFFGIGVYHPKTEVNIGTLWRTANILGAAFVYTIGPRYRRQSSDTLQTPRHVPLYNYETMEDLRDHLPDACPLVGVELTEAAMDLRDFKHPERACYLLGAEDHGLPPQVMATCHYLVKLRGDHSMNVAVAGSIVLYHRTSLKESVI
jgi:tRNA G18 (ribose-2'-O)-methylase SpoU